MSITSISNSGTYGKKSASIREAKETSLLANNQFQIQYLVVGGGGGGGWGGHGVDQRGGGGGGGGFRNSTEGEETGYPETTPEPKFTATLGTNYTVTVGGGAGSHTSGNDSIFGSVTAHGGGRGGQVHRGGAGGTSRSKSNSGSGGGGQSGDYGNLNWGGGGNPGQGGQGANNSGGGGAGGNGSGGASGAGDAGKSSSITGSSVTYSAGARSLNPTTGAVNTGTGGGGSNSYETNGGSGGSGIVVLKWLANEATITIGGSLVYTDVSSGDYSIIKFTSGSDNVSFA
jgi:hypothetical protein